MLPDLFHQMSEEFQARYWEWANLVYKEICASFIKKHDRKLAQIIQLEKIYVSLGQMNFKQLMAFIPELPKPFKALKYAPEIQFPFGKHSIYHITFAHAALTNQEKRLFLLTVLEQWPDYIPSAEILFRHPYLDLFLEDAEDLGKLYKLANQNGAHVNILTFAEEEIWDKLLSRVTEEKFLTDFLNLIPISRKFRAFHYLLRQSATEDALHQKRKIIKDLFFLAKKTCHKYRDQFDMVVQICILEFKKAHPRNPAHQGSMKFLSRGPIGSITHCNTIFSYHHAEQIDKRLQKYQCQLAKQNIKISLAPYQKKYISNLDLIPLCQHLAENSSLLGNVYEFILATHITKTPKIIEQLLKLVDFHKYGTKNWVTRELSAVELFFIVPILQDLDDINIYIKKFCYARSDLYEERYEDLKFKKIEHDILTYHFVDFKNAQADFGELNLYNLSTPNLYLHLLGNEIFQELKELRQQGRWTYDNFARVYNEITKPAEIVEPILRPIL